MGSTKIYLSKIKTQFFCPSVSTSMVNSLKVMIAYIFKIIQSLLKWSKFVQYNVCKSEFTICVCYAWI